MVAVHPEGQELCSACALPQFSLPVFLHADEVLLEPCYEEYSMLVRFRNHLQRREK